MKPARKLNYYELLGVSREATNDEIKNARSNCAKEFHPDTFQYKEEVSELEKKIRGNIMKQINEAYGTLSDFHKNCKYDIELEAREMSDKEKDLYDDAIYQEIKYRLSENKPVDFYALLGVSPKSELETIKTAFFERVTAYHPDLPANKNDSKNVRASIYKCLKMAYIILTDENNKEKYDEAYENAYSNQIVVKETKVAVKESKKRLTKPKTANKEKKTSSKKYSAVKTRSFIETVKTGWKEVREDEKTEPFKERHKSVSDHLAHSKLASANPIVYNISAGTIHVCCETLYQLYKLRYITEDNIPKFIIRNRVTIGSLLLAGALILTPKLTSSPDINPDPTPALPEVTDTINPDGGKKGSTAEEETITLNRIHVVKYGETVSEYSKESNSTIKYIAKVNDLEVNYDNSVNIQAGQKITIPYVIDKEDLPYYTSSKNLPDGMSLSAFASMNNTDIDTLLRLNPEAIEVNNEDPENITYFVASDSLTVPDFISKSEYKSLKAQTEKAEKVKVNN